MAEFHLGSPTTLEADLLALKEGEPESEKKFDFSLYGEGEEEGDSWTESWEPDGTGMVVITMAFHGCPSANQTWKIHKEVVTRKANK